MELRSRVIAFVEEGHGHREAARHFRVSPRFVNDMVILKRTTGGLAPKPRGHRAPGKLAPYAAWVRGRIAAQGGLTLDEIVAELASVHCLSVHRGAVGKWLHRLGLSHKKNAARQRNPAAGHRRAAQGVDRDAPA
jgi:transposase